MIKDQRRIYDIPLTDDEGRPLPGLERGIAGLTPAHIEQHWHQFADRVLQRKGYMFENRQDATDFRTSRRKLVAYLNHSRWCADCPERDCNGGIALWPDNPQACCLDCGSIFTKIEWPDENELNRVLVVALQLPAEEGRNWHPGRESATEAIEKMLVA